MEIAVTRTPKPPQEAHPRYVPQPFSKGVVIRTIVFMSIFALFSFMLMLFGAIGPWTYGSNIFTSISLVIIGILGTIFSITLIFLTPHAHKHAQLFEFYSIGIGFLRLTSTGALFFGVLCILHSFIELRWFINEGYYERDKGLNQRWVEIYADMPDYKLMTERDSVYPNHILLLTRGIAACAASLILFILTKLFQVGHNELEKDRARGFTIFARFVFLTYVIAMHISYYPVFGSIDHMEADVNRVFYWVTITIFSVVILIEFISFVVIIVLLSTGTVADAANNLLTKEQKAQMEAEGDREEEIKMHVLHMSRYTCTYRIFKFIPVFLWGAILLHITCQFILGAATNYSNKQVYEEIENEVHSFLTNWEKADLAMSTGQRLARPAVCIDVYWSAIIFGTTLCFFIFESLRDRSNTARFLKSYTIINPASVVSPSHSSRTPSSRNSNRSTTSHSPSTRNPRGSQVINITNVHPAYVVQTLNPLGQPEVEMNEEFRIPSRLHGTNEYIQNDTRTEDVQHQTENIPPHSIAVGRQSPEWNINPLNVNGPVPKEVIR
ncbi:hypothetical protein BLNAU_4087 [Blattamonas nauphoetae]|uniref:Transmembrane protein n=1 Tax=Blattamonas nauphoetae TaxID=2049346 RepID=A0ABQ9YB57_9EUKA|nr:hypothetical protein BLNAU_4087 [Blattamonas nauphoetae]